MGRPRFNGPSLIMTVGIPGSGKTTWLTKCFLSDRILKKIAHICPDRIREEEFKNISDQANNVEVWRIAKEKTIEHLKEGRTVILDATNVSTPYRRLFINGLPPCQLKAKIFEADPEECWQRIRDDIQRKVSRANVPRDVIYRMHEDLLYTLKVIENEGFELIEDF